MSLKLEVNKEYRTRDGRKARVICTDLQHPEYSVVALISNGVKEKLFTYTARGAAIADDCDNTLDLIAPWTEPRTVTLREFVATANGLIWTTLCNEEQAHGLIKAGYTVTSLPGGRTISVEVPDEAK